MNALFMNCLYMYIIQLTCVEFSVDLSVMCCCLECTVGSKLSKLRPFLEIISSSQRHSVSKRHTENFTRQFKFMQSLNKALRRIDAGL